MKTVFLAAVLHLLCAVQLASAPYDVIRADNSPLVYAGCSESGKTLFIASKSGTAGFYYGDGTMTNGIIHGAPLSGASFSRNGEFAATVSVSGTVKLWDATAGSLLKTFQNTAGPVNDCAFSADAGLLASAGKEIYIWDTKKFGRHKTFKTDVESKTVLFSGNGGFFAFAAGRSLYLWKLSSNSLISLMTGKPSPETKELKTLNHHLTINDAAFSTDSEYIAAGGDSGVVSCFRAEDGYRMWRSPMTKETIRSLVFTGGSGHLLSAGDSGIIYIHNPSDGKISGTIGPLPSAVNSLEFNGKTAVLYAGCEDGSVYVIKTAFKKPLPPISSMLKTAGLIFLALALGALILFVIASAKGKSVKDWRV
jgi:WD40 repeat protein